MTSTPNPVDVRAGENVRKTRLRIGMSQEKLAEKIGLTFQQVQKYEKGANRMGVSRLAQIAGALDVEIPVLLDGIEGGGRASVPPATQGLAERLESLKPSDRRIADDVIDRLIVASMAETPLRRVA